MNTATAIVGPRANVKPLVIAYADYVPAQLDQLIEKRGMQLEVRSSRGASAAELLAIGARMVLVDVDLPQNEANDPARLIAELHAGAPETAILVISHRGDEAFLNLMAASGALGVVVKRPAASELAHALELLSVGRGAFPNVESEAGPVHITAREKEVLQLMAAGLTNARIAERLKISNKTVEAHRSRLFKKLGATNVAGAIMLAMRAGLITA